MKIGKDRNLGIGVDLKNVPIIDESGVHVVIQGKGSAADTVVELTLDREDIEYLQNVDFSNLPRPRVKPLVENELQDSAAGKKINQIIDQLNFITDQLRGRALLDH